MIQHVVIMIELSFLTAIIKNWTFIPDITEQILFWYLCQKEVIN